MIQEEKMSRPNDTFAILFKFVEACAVDKRAEVFFHLPYLYHSRDVIFEEMNGFSHHLDRYLRWERHYEFEIIRDVATTAVVHNLVRKTPEITGACWVQPTLVTGA